MILSDSDDPFLKIILLEQRQGGKTGPKVVNPLAVYRQTLIYHI